MSNSPPPELACLPALSKLFPLLFRNTKLLRFNTCNWHEGVIYVARSSLDTRAQLNERSQFQPIRRNRWIACMCHGMGTHRHRYRHTPPTMKCHGKLKQFSNYVQSNRTDTIIIIAISTPTAGALCFSLNVKCNLALHTNDRQITPENASIATLFGSTRQFCCRFNLQLFVALVCLCFFLVLLIQECCLC